MFIFWCVLTQITFSRNIQISKRFIFCKIKKNLLQILKTEVRMKKQVPVDNRSFNGNINKAYRARVDDAALRWDGFLPDPSNSSSKASVSPLSSSELSMAQMHQNKIQDINIKQNSRTRVIHNLSATQTKHKNVLDCFSNLGQNISRFHLLICASSGVPLREIYHLHWSQINPAEFGRVSYLLTKKEKNVHVLVNHTVVVKCYKDAT